MAFVVAALAVLVFAGVANASLTVNYVFTGHGGYSADGLGQFETGGTLQAEVPAGSTVQKAFLLGTYFTNAPDVEQRTIDFDGTMVETTQISTVSFLSTTRAEVTAQVAAKVDSGGGITDFAINNDPSEMDGVALVVVYSNPAMPENTIAVLDGGASQDGDTATFLLASPLDKTVPGFQATMSLGSGFSYQGIDGHACGGGQFSIVEVNSQLLSNCAGNFDDGGSGDGALITVGGVGDSTDNPTPPNEPATDDELYNLSPFLAQGATNIEIRSSNPSADDNLFLAVISITARAQVSNEDCDNGIDDDGDGLIDGDDPDCQLPSGIVLDPATATNLVGTEHTVTATVRGTDGALLGEAEVTFTVTDGPNSSVTATEFTDGNGEASFTYTGDGGPGTDTIEATFVEGEDVHTATATKTWVTAALPPPPPPPASPPPPPAPTPADLTITIKAEELPPASAARTLAVAAGTRMRYLVTVTNNGPGVARNVTLTHGAPAGSSFDSVSTDTGSCSGSSTVSCSFGSLAVGQQAHVTTTATLAQTGSATATASVSASEPDPSSANNSASTTTDVTASVTGQGVPVFGTTAVPVVVSGFVCAQLPNTTECVDISTLTEIPVGSIIDTTRGRVRLTVANSAGTLETVELYEGVFQLFQSTAARSTQARSQAASVTEFKLTGGDFSKCTAQPAKAKAKKAKKKRKPAVMEQAKPRQPVRRLWGEGKGRFRTRGRYSSATVRGTVWLTEDYCNGTLIRVEEGTVTVRDLVKNRTVVVTAGKSYFAEAPARKAAKAKAKPKKRKAARG